MSYTYLAASGSVIQIRLCDQVRHPQLWPTPTVCGNNNRKGLTKTSGDGLATAVRGRDLNGGNTTPQTQTARLNPYWVEWLMGWPIGWTDLKPLATDKFRSWRQQLFIF